MNLNTERIINNIKYPRTTNQKIKYSQEYCVLAVLKYYFPEEFVNFEHSESPDLRNDSYGVEVVSITDEKERKVESLFDKYQIASQEKQDTTSFINKIYKGYTIDASFGKSFLQYPISTSAKEKKLFLDVIAKKVSKCSDYETKCSRVDLAVYFPEIPTTECLENLPNWARDSFEKNKNKYGRIFFVSNRNLTVVETETWTTINSIEIPQKTWQAFRKIGKLTADGLIKLTDPEWN